jgi:hypothetical protein
MVKPLPIMLANVPVSPLWWATWCTKHNGHWWKALPWCEGLGLQIQGFNTKFILNRHI